MSKQAWHAEASKMIRACRLRVSSHASGLSIAPEEEFNGMIEIVSYLREEGGNDLHERTQP
ncbi:hypothetical protein CP49_10025 [Bradyrhizobium valentinum]|uniref:Uncharacterized protein n=1 Tax=Bradyrhizobium valentinum TaxID=1518501 RepID=A0A0R3LC67_9BRAD|nr:hypothetical protein CP49_10025 [Bradyrhizobium valentinum]